LYFVLFNLNLFFGISKNMNPVLKYQVFVKTFKKIQKKLKFWKNVFVHTVKCLKAKKS
jgi:hypothetical protein